MVKSQLNYCPLVWMFCPTRSNNLINKVLERALRIIYNDQLTDFKSLLLITVQGLMTETCKIINHIAPPIMLFYLKYVQTLITRDIFKFSLMKAGEQ